MRKSIILSLFVILTGAAAKAETWYLYTTVHTGGHYSAATRPAVLEMDTEEGCKQAGSQIQADVKENKIQHVKNFSFACIKRQ